MLKKITGYIAWVQNGHALKTKLAQWTVGRPLPLLDITPTQIASRLQLWAALMPHPKANASSARDVYAAEFPVYVGPHNIQHVNAISTHVVGGVINDGELLAPARNNAQPTALHRDKTAAASWRTSSGTPEAATKFPNIWCVPDPSLALQGTASLCRVRTGGGHEQHWLCGAPHLPIRCLQRKPYIEKQNKMLCMLHSFNTGCQAQLNNMSCCVQRVQHVLRSHSPSTQLHPDGLYHIGDVSLFIQQTCPNLRVCEGTPHLGKSAQTSWLHTLSMQEHTHIEFALLTLRQNSNHRTDLLAAAQLHTHVVAACQLATHQGHKRWFLIDSLTPNCIYDLEHDDIVTLVNNDWELSPSERPDVRDPVAALYSNRVKHLGLTSMSCRTRWAGRFASK